MTATIEDVVARAADDGIRLVRFLYCDPAGVIRGKNVHVARLASRMREGIGMTRAQNALNMLDQLVAAGSKGWSPWARSGSRPTRTRTASSTGCPGTASMLSDQLGHDGLDWGSCPRSFLKRVIAEAEDAGIRVMAAFENEFYLAQEIDGQVVPWQDGPVLLVRRAWTGPRT